jgi:hypothetical protein
MSRQEQPARGVLASPAAAVVAVFAAVSCCLPLGPFLVAAGLAGASGFFLSIQPYLIVFAVLMLAFGFVQAVRSRRCGRKRTVLNVAVLLCSTVLVGAMLFSLLPARTPPAIASFHIDAFRSSFNAAADRTRVVALFSPT